MDFTLTDEQQKAAEMVRRFAQEEVAPTIREWDRRQEMDPTVLPRMAELGILGICLPVRYGGQGFDYITLGLVCEELERVDTSLRVVMSVHVGLCSLALLQWATEEQKQRFLIPQAKGDKYAGFGLTESGVGSDVANMTSSGKKQGNAYVLNGEKMWISLASKAHHFLVVVRTNPEAKQPADGLSAFMITRDMAGVTTGDIHGKLGVRAGSTGWISMANVKVPAENRIGEDGEGFRIAMSALDNGRLTVAAGATGLIRASMEESVKYGRERHTFGKPIAHHQLVKQKIAHMSLWYESARLLYLRAAWLKNQGVRNTRETSLAKWYATDQSVQAALEAIQVHGAYGYSDEYNVERYLRNSKGAVIYEGTSEIHQLMQADYALGFREDHALRCELPPYQVDAWQSEG
jgi:alkylation response protein AidB-like acyl-CoA dehydrogenase